MGEHVEKMQMIYLSNLDADDFSLISDLTFEQETVALAAKGTLDRSPKKNWVENMGGLPKYIEDIAQALHRGGMTISRAIATAVSRVKRWAAGGDGVKPDTVAKASAAVAQWEALKAKAHAKGATK